MKKRMLQTSFVVTLTLGLLAGSGGHAYADSGSDNTAAVVNTIDDSFRSLLAFKTTRDTDDLADEQNTAAAVSSCERCQTVAVAVQVVLLFDDPSVLSTKNIAFALNQECTSCRTLASAYQFVMTTDGPVRFSPSGTVSIERIRQHTLAATQSRAPITEIQAEVDVLMDELEALLETELRAAGRSGDVARFTDGDTAV